jgi:hypothetical protein
MIVGECSPRESLEASIADDKRYMDIQFAALRAAIRKVTEAVAHLAAKIDRMH